MAGDTRQVWGWHRLDKSWARRIVGDAGVAPGELVLDIGAGNGALTDALLRAGARVVAVELHRQRAMALRQRFAGRPVVVVQVDAADLRLPKQPFRVVANPPFSITTALLKRLLSPGSSMRGAHLVVPWHAARRWSDAGAPGERRWSRTFSASLGAVVPRRAFVPPPPRDARLLVIRRR